MSIASRRLSRTSKTTPGAVSYGTRIGLAVASGDQAAAMSTLSNRWLADRMYLQTDRLTTIQSDIESALAASPQVLPVVSGKWTTQAQFQQIATDLAGFANTSRFVLAYNHEPYPETEPTDFVQRYGWLMDAISSGNNNTKVVPAIIFNGWAYQQGGTQRKNKLDTVYGDGIPGSGIMAYHQKAIMTRLKSLGGIVGADFYDTGTYDSGAGYGPAVGMQNCYNFWTGVGFTDNLGLNVKQTDIVINRFGAGELGTFDKTNGLAGMQALQDLGFIFGCWWDHDGDHMWMDTAATANSPNAVAFRQKYLAVYTDSIGRSALAVV